MKKVRVYNQTKDAAQEVIGRLCDIKGKKTKYYYEGNDLELDN